MSFGHLSEDDEAKMYEFYGLAHPPMPAGTHIPRPDDAVIRSEAQIRVGKSAWR